MSFNEIFHLESPQELDCSMDKYMLGHSSLWIRVMNKSEFLCYLHFIGVQYISAPMYWKSADFSIASPEECQQLLMKIGYHERLIVEVDHFKLFEVKNPDIKIQILAAHGEKHNHDILSKKTQLK